MSKIVNLKDLEKIISDIKEKNKKIVHCHGCFDLLHLGHIKHFEAAKKFGDILIVTVTPDKFINKGPGRPVFKEKLRLEALAALSVVDYVALNHWQSSVNTIKLIKPDFYIRGFEYKKRPKDRAGNFSKENEAVKKIGGKIEFTDEITFSSSNLINKYYNPLPDSSQEFTNKFRKKYNEKSIIRKLQALKDLKVLVIGEAIIDEYTYCRAVGKPIKAPVISSKFIRKERFAGGSLAVANHIASFVSSIDLVTCIGKNSEDKKFIRSKLNNKINPHLFIFNSGSTPIKRRYVENFRKEKMFEIAFIDDDLLDRKIEKKIIDWLNKNIKKFNLVVVTDFGHGMMTPKIIKLLTQKANFLAVNTQTNSLNYGFNPITKYKKIDYCSIDERELRICFSDKYNDTKNLIKKLKKEIKCPQINVTLGHRGNIYYRNNYFYRTPILSTNVLDNVGAGDAVFSITSLLSQQQEHPSVISFIGNCVGALAVQIICNKEPVDNKKLSRFITGILK
jgi:rfaE bifunctional protein nucleotidyltransferase chain/domain